jgi:hypothetical protein
MKKLLFFALVSVLFISSCKKDNASGLVGKWTIDKIEIKEYTNNQLTGTFEMPGGGQIVEFKSNGKAIHPFYTGEVDYKIQGNKVIIDDEESEIRNLTGNSVILYSVDIDGADKTEITTYLKK